MNPSDTNTPETPVASSEAQTETKPVRKVIGAIKGTKGQRIAFLLALGMWDGFSMEDRKEFGETGTIYDTPNGKVLKQMCMGIGKRNNERKQIIS